MTDTAQIYLQTPEQFDLADFTPVLAKILDAIPIACLRISMTTNEAKTLGRAADALREICHSRDIAIVIDNHFRLAETHGLDGVHITDGAKSIREARKQLGKDAIIGAFCGTSKHAGITAAEIGVDYVSFGPLADTGLGDGSTASPELFQWWSEIIEVPVVAEGAINDTTLASVKDHIDFICLGKEIWGENDPQAALQAIVAQLG